MLQEAICRVLDLKPAVEEDKIDGYIFRSVKNIAANKKRDDKRMLSLDEQASAWEVLASVDFEGRVDYGSRADLDGSLDFKGRVDYGSRADLDGSESENPYRQFSAIDAIRYAETFPSPVKEAFFQSRVEGKNHEEIAQEMGVSVRTVENYLHKSVVLFRNKFRRAS